MHRKLLVTLTAAAALGTLGLAPSAQAVTAGSAAAPATMQARPGTLTPLLVGARTGRTTVVLDDTAARPAAAAAAARINVTYHGFTAASKAAFQRAVNTWAANITSTVPITVDATFTALPTGVLGSAGPGTLLRDFAGAPRAGVFYTEWAANKFARKQLVPGTPDIIARFSSTRTDWNFGTAPAAANKIDFQSVVAHELGHGLGFLGAGSVTAGGAGTVRFSGFPSVYDRHTITGAGRTLLSFPDNSVALGNALKSNGLFITIPGIAGRSKIYAPSTFQPGSSYSHLDEATFRAGNANSLMTPILGFGETIRTPGNIAKTAINCFASATC